MLHEAYPPRGRTEYGCCIGSIGIDGWHWIDAGAGGREYKRDGQNG